MDNETLALGEMRKAWDSHVTTVTKALDKIAKLSAAPASEDNSTKIEEFVAKINESSAAIGEVLARLEPAPAPEPVPKPAPVETPADGGVAAEDPLD